MKLCQVSLVSLVVLSFSVVELLQLAISDLLYFNTFCKLAHLNTNLQKSFILSGLRNLHEFTDAIKLTA